jgi:hypothetical protein
MESRATGVQGSPRGERTVLWVLAVLLAFLGGTLWQRGDSALLAPALAQAPAMAGARGVYAFAGQIDAGVFGLFMLDVDQGTIWCYQVQNEGGTRKLKLVAGRSWIYDRYLKNFNVTGHSWSDVQELVDHERRTGNTAPSVPPTAAEPGVQTSDRR